MDPTAWEAFCRSWIRLLLESVDGAIYCAMSSKELPLVSRVFAEEGGHWSDTIIWAKDRFVLGRADYQRAYEPIWFGWRDGSTHHWCGDRDQGDVWTIARAQDSCGVPDRLVLDRSVERDAELNRLSNDQHSTVPAG